MITNLNELEVAYQDLRNYETALDAIRQELLESNPSLFPVVSKGYTLRIREIREDIFAYLRERPADAPFKIRLTGPSIGAGTVQASVIARLLAALQSAVYQVGKTVDAATRSGAALADMTGLRAILGLNLVAIQPGSFILVLDLAPRQLSLFNEYEIAETTLLSLFSLVDELTQPNQAFSGEKAVLRSLDKVSALLQPNKIAKIEFSYRWGMQTRETSITPDVREKINGLLKRPREGDETVKGVLVSINVEGNFCQIRPDGQELIRCGYLDDIEDDLILALRKQVEVSGVMEPPSKSANRPRIKFIERFRTVGNVDDDLDALVESVPI